MGGFCTIAPSPMLQNGLVRCQSISCCHWLRDGVLVVSIHAITHAQPGKSPAMKQSRLMGLIAKLVCARSYPPSLLKGPLSGNIQSLSRTPPVLEGQSTLIPLLNWPVQFECCLRVTRRIFLPGWYALIERRFDDSKFIRWNSRKGWIMNDYYVWLLGMNIISGVLVVSIHAITHAQPGKSPAMKQSRLMGLIAKLVCARSYPPSLLKGPLSGNIQSLSSTPPVLEGQSTLNPPS